MYRRKGKYCKALIEKMFDEAKKEIGKLYDANVPLPDNPNKTSKLLNVVSNFKDDERNIEDFLAEKILKLGIEDRLKEYIKNNPVKIRESGYNAKHNPENIKFNKDSKRRENNIVRFLYKYKEELNKESIIKNTLGEIIDYEIPLTEGTKNNIDMLAITDDCVNIIEWKTDSKSCSDSLLRAIMEITTYEYELNKEKIIEDFGLNKRRYNSKSFKKIIAIFDNTKPGITYRAISDENKKTKVSNIAKLLKKLDIKVVLLSSESIPKPITNETKISERKIKLA